VHRRELIEGFAQILCPNLCHARALFRKVAYDDKSERTSENGHE
jgi:hypothetical protein